MWGQRGYGDDSTRYVPQQYHLASMASWLSFTGFSHHNLLPHGPLIRLFTVNSNHRPGIAPQSLNSSSQLLHLLGLCVPGWQGLSDSHSIGLQQIGCFNLSLRSFPSNSDSCPNVGMGLLLQFPNPRRAGPVLLTLLFPPLVPLSYWVLCGSIYSFPLVKYSLHSQLVLSMRFVSVGVFLMYPWRERYSTSSFSSTILFSSSTEGL